MSKKIPLYLRNSVNLRANKRCEYCQIPDIDSYYGFQIDHIIFVSMMGKLIWTIWLMLVPIAIDTNGLT